MRSLVFSNICIQQLDVDTHRLNLQCLSPNDADYESSESANQSVRARPISVVLVTVQGAAPHDNTKMTIHACARKSHLQRLLCHKTTINRVHTLQ